VLDEGESVEVSVDFSSSRLGGSGMLWASNSGNHRLLGYSGDQMAYEGAVTEEPEVTLTLPDLGSGDALPGPIAFDASGKLWVGYCGTTVPGRMAAFEPATLEASATIAPAIEIAGPSTFDHVCVTSLTFDVAGNLWVGFYGDALVRYTPDALTQSGFPAPDIQVHQDSITGLQDLVLDAAGSLFASAYISDSVEKYLPAALATSMDNVEPVVTWTGPNVFGPTGFAFERGGNLWLATYSDSTLRAYAPATQATSGNPDPLVEITSDDVVGPQFITFDEAGNLWVANYDSSKVTRLDAADLGSDSDVSASAVYASLSMSANYSVRINPSANGD
jgi:sugar lactone lactonase YvrE